jgi:hypothetical protein
MIWIREVVLFVVVRVPGVEHGVDERLTVTVKDPARVCVEWSGVSASEDTSEWYFSSRAVWSRTIVRTFHVVCSFNTR